MAKKISRNMAPPPTGSAWVSFSSWRAVPEVETRLCHPEIAPQAMVTKSIGHKGPLAVQEFRVHWEVAHSGMPDHDPEHCADDSQGDDPEGHVVDRLGKRPDG